MNSTGIVSFGRIRPLPDPMTSEQMNDDPLAADYQPRPMVILQDTMQKLARKAPVLRRKKGQTLSRGLAMREAQEVLDYISGRLDDAEDAGRDVLYILMSEQLATNLWKLRALKAASSFMKKNVEGCVGQVFGLPVVASPYLGNPGNRSIDGVWYEGGVPADIKTVPRGPANAVLEAEWQRRSVARQDAFMRGQQPSRITEARPTRQDPLGQGVGPIAEGERPGPSFGPPMRSLSEEAEQMVLRIEAQETALARVQIPAAELVISDGDWGLLRTVAPFATVGSAYKGMQIRIDNRRRFPLVRGPNGEQVMDPTNPLSSGLDRTVWTDV